MAKRKTQKKSRSGFIFLFIIVILLGVIFYAYKDKCMVFLKTAYTYGKEFVNRNIKKENFDIVDKIKHIEKKDTESKKLSEEKKIDAKKDSNEIKISEKNENPKKNENKDTKNNETKKIANNEKVNKNIKTTDISEEKSSEKKGITENKKTEKKEININKTKKIQNAKIDKENKKSTSNIRIEKELNSKIAKIYFTQIDDQDNLTLKSIPRKIIYTDSPLTETIKVLLAGPQANEEKLSIVTNIPPDSKLLSVKVNNNVAYINFNKNFEYNQFGRESTINQLKQIVYTATEFKNVKSVQFMIEGNIKTYLGGEGVIINRPLSRDDFS